MYRKMAIRNLINRSRTSVVLGIVVIVWIIAIPALAEITPDNQMNWMGLLGGLALFLFGMEQMADALKAVASKAKCHCGKVCS